jgi:hypothetical protein
MSIFAAVLFPIYLATSAASVGDNRNDRPDLTEIIESRPTSECSETVLRFVIGGILGQTESDYCSSQNTVDDQSGS